MYDLRFIFYLLGRVLACHLSRLKSGLRMTSEVGLFTASPPSSGLYVPIPHATKKREYRISNVEYPISKFADGFCFDILHWIFDILHSKSVLQNLIDCLNAIVSKSKTNFLSQNPKSYIVHRNSSIFLQRWIILPEITQFSLNTFPSLRFQ